MLLDRKPWDTEFSFSLLNDLDWHAVTERMNARDPGEGPLPEFDEQDARQVVVLAAEEWLARDLKESTLKSVEMEFKIRGFHGFVDLLLHTQHGLQVIDWKTTRQTLDAEWRQRLLDSWQWRFYAYMTGARRFSYRGINKKGERKELLLEVPTSVADECDVQLRGILAMKGSLLDTGLNVWPRNTKSCFAFGRQCARYAECQGETMPPGVPEDGDMSFSQMELFLLCPERCRRGILDKQAGLTGESSEESSFGRYVHRGLAEVYFQAFKL